MSNIKEVFDRYEFEPLWPDQQIRPTEKRLRKLEHIIGTYLPDDYCTFLLEYGALSPSGHKSNSLGVWAPARGKFAHIFGFMGFFRRDESMPGIRNSDLIYAYRRKAPTLGVSFLPIALGSQYEWFCLKLSGERKGSIWAWIPDPVQGDTWEAMVQVYGFYCVAPDIASFVTSIQDCPD